MPVLMSNPYLYVRLYDYTVRRARIARYANVEPPTRQPAVSLAPSGLA